MEIRWFDGIIFASSRLNQNLNQVLFHRTNICQLMYSFSQIMFTDAELLQFTKSYNSVIKDPIYGLFSALTSSLLLSIVPLYMQGSMTLQMAPTAIGKC
jgi:hypothetical protein